jgi:hypothetical protein
VFTGSFYWNAKALGIQCAGISVTILVSVVGTLLIYGVLWTIATAAGDTVYIPLEMQGNADLSQHGESAYFSSSPKKPTYVPHSSLVVRASDSVAADGPPPAAAPAGQGAV